MEDNLIMSLDLRGWTGTVGGGVSSQSQIGHLAPPGSPPAPLPPAPSSIILFKLQSRSFKRLALDGNRIFPLQVTSRPVSVRRGLNQQKKIIRFVQIKSVMSRARAVPNPAGSLH